MTLQEMGVGDLASRVGISKRKLKKHFKPEYFQKLSLKVLKKYSIIFDIPVVSMLQLMIIKQEDKDKISVEYLKSDNESFIITKIGLKNNG